MENLAEVGMSVDEVRHAATFNMQQKDDLFGFVEKICNISYSQLSK